MGKIQFDFRGKQDLAWLLRTAGERVDDISIHPYGGGGNNRVFKIIANNSQYIVKQYFVHPSDKRNRLMAEYKFLEYARYLGLQCVPRPLACHLKKGVALYEYIEGTSFQEKDMTPLHVEEAINFFLALNSPDRFKMENVLPDASEACFSIHDQISLIRRRIFLLSQISPFTPVDRAAIEFVKHLKAVFEKAVAIIIKTTAKTGMNVNAVLAPEYRCISPSDFGFHNALLGRDDKVYFLDFEYAGWDDPAKMACDFFCQPAIPVNKKYFIDFLQKVMSFSPNPALLINRALITLPLYRIKWCCIILNEFLPESSKRRRFADPNADMNYRKYFQLIKAQSIFSTISV